jgi:hypothetical protein
VTYVCVGLKCPYIKFNCCSSRRDGCLLRLGSNVPAFVSMTSQYSLAFLFAELYVTVVQMAVVLILVFPRREETCGSTDCTVGGGKHFTFYKQISASFKSFHSFQKFITIYLLSAKL